MMDKNALICGALDYMRSILKEKDGGDTISYIPDVSINFLSSGGGSINIHQHHQGLLVHGMTSILYFDKNGVFFDGRLKTILIDATVKSWPRISAADALKSAIKTSTEKQVMNTFSDPSVDLGGLSLYEPTIVYKFSHLVSCPTVLSKGPYLLNIPAHLLYVECDKKLRLAWHMVVTLADLSTQFKFIISADSEECVILDVCNELCNISYYGNIYPLNPGCSDREKLRLAGQLTSSVKWVVQAEKLQGEAAFINTEHVFPEEYIENKDHDESFFNPPDMTVHQFSLNAFYFCNYLHDIFELLGFDEFSGNFQQINYQCSEGGNDAVGIKISMEQIAGTAGMTTDVDGKPPLMFLGPNKNGRHTAVDFDIVAHEYSHGITNRIVGGRYNVSALSALQSKGMGEGWSDYFALTLQNYKTGCEKTVIGDWLEGSSCGSRRAPYDNHYPYDYISLSSAGSFHQIGEVWCAVLMKMTRLLVAHAPVPQKGYWFSLQLVMDGLKLTPANPHFLDGRDAILLAASGMSQGNVIDDVTYRSITNSIWQAFASFGMGKHASSGDSGLENLVADYTAGP